MGSGGALNLPGRPVSFSGKMVWFWTLTVSLIVFQTAYLPLGNFGLLPLSHFVNVVSGMVLGPWYALTVAVLGTTFHTSAATGTLFAFPAVIPGGVAVGLARKYLPSKRWTAPLFEPAGTFVGATLSYALVMTGSLSSRVSFPVFLGLFLASSCLGAILAFLVMVPVTEHRRRRAARIRAKPALILAVLLFSVLFSTAPASAVGPTASQSVTANFLSSGSSMGSTTSWLEGYSNAVSNDTTIYGPNQPFLLYDLAVNLSPDLVCLGCPYYLANARITVAITNSTGSGDTDFGNPSLLATPDPGTGATYLYQSRSEQIGFQGGPSVWGQWVNVFADRKTVNEKVSLTHQPVFFSTGAHAITVTSHAEVWENLDSFRIRDSTATSSYSFVYVYESDAGSGHDAGNCPASSFGIAPGSYDGLLYGNDTQDLYRFDVAAGKPVSVKMTADSGASFGLRLYDQNNNLIAESANGPGAADSLSTVATLTGTWYLQVYAITGSGSYHFQVQSSSS